MKILIPVDPFIPVPPKHYGGVERIVAALVLKLQQRGHTVGLVAHPDSTVPADYFLPWPKARPANFGDHARNTITLVKAHGEFRATVIHSFARLLYMSPLLLNRVPKIMSYGRHTGGRQVKIAAFIARQSLAFTGCSKFIADMGRQYGGEWHAIPNFVDPHFFHFCPTVADDAPLVFLSRVETIKGAHVAIEVAKRTGRRLIIAGNHADSGHEQRYWLDSIEPELGRNGIEYAGPVDDRGKMELLSTAWAMIVPIQWDEPFGIVFAESLACGTPVISCPRGALPEIIREGIDGFLVRTVEEACRAVAKVGEIKRRECRARVENAFSTDIVVRQYESLYENLLSRAWDRRNA